MERPAISVWNRRPLFSAGGSAGAWSVLSSPENSARNRRPSGVFGRVAAPAHVCSVLRILFGIDDPLAVSVLAQHALRFVANYRLVAFTAGDSI